MSPDERASGSGVLGCGNVGAPLVELIAAQRADHRRPHRPPPRGRPASRSATSPSRGRSPLPADRLTDDAGSIVDDPDIDLVVELIGGVEPARDLILTALKAGKPVVTGNKELLAKHGAELFEAAERAGVDLLFEAAVAGGIPIIRPLRESLVGERITRVMGIVNGTTNYILTRMTEAGASYADALAEAQALGYAEADPTADVEGYDAGAKAAIIASIAFGAAVTAGDVHHEGITRHHRGRHRVRRQDGLRRQAAGGGRADRRPARSACGCTRPWSRSSTRWPPCARASTPSSWRAPPVGDLMFYGRGAGGSPTASAILGDLIDAAVNRHKGSHASVGQLSEAVLRPIDDAESAYYLNLEVLDRPGVLAQVAGVFGDHGVSIRSMEQEGLGDEARLIFITHRARHADVQATLAALGELEAVDRIGSVLRVLGDDL